MARPFDGYGDYVHLTKEEIESMAYEYDRINWRDWAAIYAGGLIGEPMFKGIIDKDKWTKVNEQSRTYHFANGVATSVYCLTWLWVSSSGTHYIKDASGQIHIIAKGWFRIEITEQEGHGRDADNQITPGTV